MGEAGDHLAALSFGYGDFGISDSGAILMQAATASLGEANEIAQLLQQIGSGGDQADIRLRLFFGKSLRKGRDMRVSTRPNRGVLRGRRNVPVPRTGGVLSAHDLSHPPHSAAEPDQQDGGDGEAKGPPAAYPLCDAKERDQPKRHQSAASEPQGGASVLHSARSPNRSDQRRPQRSRQQQSQDKEPVGGAPVHAAARRTAVCVK